MIDPNYLIFLLILVLAIIVGRILFFARRGERFVRGTTVFSRHPDHPSEKILCLGDSLTMGVGATTPEKSFVGHLVQDFPNADITNWSRSGITSGKLLDYVKTQKLDHYDLVIFQVGGMDVVRFTNLTKLRRTLTEFLTLMKAHSTQIVLISPNTTGYMPLYHLPITDILNWRAGQIHKIYKDLAKKLDCTLVEINIDVLAADTKRYYSPDRIHPNDAGYALWYESIKPVFQKTKA